MALKTIVKSEAERDEATKRLQDFIAQGRLEAEVDVLIQSGGEVFETIRTASQQASLVFLGLRMPEPDETSEAYSQYYRHLLAAITGFPPTVLVLAAKEVELHRVFFR